MQNSIKKYPINCISLNPKLEIAAISTDKGFELANYNTREKIVREVGPISIIAVFKIQPSEEFQNTEKAPQLRELSQKYCVAYVPASGEPSKKFNIYSLVTNSIIMQFKMKATIHHICARGQIVTVCTQESIAIYDIEQSLMNGKGAVKRIQVENMKSLVDINLVGKNNQSFIAYSGLDKFLKGKVNIIPIGQWDTEYEIEAHKSYIDFIRLSPDGKFLATASEKGTLIRIYELSLEERDTITNDPIFKIHKEFRRGLASKHIKDINFGHGNQFITVSSNSEKIHLFWLKDGENVKSKFKALGFINSYLGSEWSKIQYTIPQGEESFCAWVEGGPRKFYLFLRSGLVRLVQIMDSKEYELRDFHGLLDFTLTMD